MENQSRAGTEVVMTPIPDIDREPRFRTSVVVMDRVTPDVFRIELEKPRFFVFEPGQYVWLILPSLNARLGVVDRRAYSIASSPNAETIELIIRLTGSDYVQAVSRLNVGDQVFIVGPMGSAFIPPKEGSIMIAGGVGVTPFLSALRSDLPGEFSLFLFVDEQRPIHVLEELNRIAKEKANVSVEIISGSPKLEKITDIARSRGRDREDRPVFVSGPQGFIDTVDEMLSQSGVSDGRARFEMSYPLRSSDIEIRKIFDAIDDTGRVSVSRELADTEESREERATLQKKMENLRKKMNFFMKGCFIALSILFSLVLLAIEYFSHGESLMIYSTISAALLLIFVLHLAGKRVDQASVALIFSLLLLSRLDPHFSEGARAWRLVFPVISIVFVNAYSSLIWSFFFIGIWEIINLVSRLDISLWIWDTPKLENSEQYPLAAILILLVVQVFSRRQEMYERDLEQSIRIREKLVDSRERTSRLNEIFVQISEQTSNHVILTDRNGQILYANRAAERLTGYSFREMRRQTPRLWGGLMDPKVARGIWKGDGHRGVSVEVLNRRRNGELYVALGHITPLIKDGRTFGFVATEEDITSFKQIDKAKTEFVSLASHQLRTPLSAINWYAEMLLSGDAGLMNEEQKQYTSEIYASNQRMVDLVNALLNVSRIDLGTFTVDPELTDVVSISRTVVKELQFDIEKKHLKFSEEYPENLPEMQFDPKLIRMIFQNLISNSVKYTPENGSVSVAVLLTKRGETIGGRGQLSDALCIKVSDTGYGIPESQQRNVFTKLFRADNVREKDTEGTGLGLYVVRSIARQSNGDTWFESVENKGTTFYVSIPLDGMKRKEGTESLS